KTDNAVFQPEAAASKLIFAAVGIGLPGQARRRDRPTNAQVRPPQAVDTEAAHRQVLPRDLQIEVPGRKLRNLDHVVLIAADMPDLELRHRSGGARLAERESAFVEMKLAGGAPAVPAPTG